MSAIVENGFELTVNVLVIESETNDFRFETFCRGVVSALEGGATILSTSLSWDLGRDGVGVGTAAGMYVCTSLRDDVDAKALADIQRIKDTTRGITRLYFCSSQRLSEHGRDKIEQALSREFDNEIPVVCLGAAQLVETAQQRSPDLLEKQYGAEIKNTLRAIKRGPGDETEIRGLRLALISSSADDSAAIRSELYKAGLLDALADGQPRTLLMCTKDFSAVLRLQRNIAVEAIRPHLQNLVTEGFIDQKSDLYSITELGIQQVKLREKDAAERLLVGRQSIRDALETAIGSRFLDDHFNVIWSVFEERMSHYFLARGDAIVAEISDLVCEGPGNVDTTSSGNSSSLSFLEELAQAVASTSANAQQRDEIYQAIKDLFTDRTSVATDWLLRLSASFLAACAAGLEHSSSAALSKLLSRTSLALDTDVVLSLMGEGEPEHDSVETIVTRWSQLGAKLLVAEPVLEEAAYHAHIAQADYDDVSSRLPGTPEERLHLIENVFVRSFAELLARNKARSSQWRAYIGQFRGLEPRDWSRLSETISTEYPVTKLPPRSSQEAQLEVDVRKFLSTDLEAKYSGDALRNAKDKARRDAELYSALVHHVKTLKATDPGATCLLVSSARRLLLAEQEFHRSGEPQLIVSVSAVLYLLSMLPDVSLGLSSMKSFLFDERRRSFSSDLERTLIRLVRSSQEYSLPWAKRGSLMRQLRESMVKEAQAQGIRRPSASDIAELEKKMTNPANAARTVEILKEALDSIALDTRTEKENAALRSKVKALEDELSKARLPKRK